MFYVYSFRQDVFKPLKAKEIEKNIFKTPVDPLKKKGMKSVAIISIFTNFFLIGVMYWLSAYVSSIQGNHVHGALALSLFFIGIMVSRLGLSKLSTGMNRAKLVAAGAVLSSVFFVIGLFMHDPYVASACFLLCGVAMGANFPQTVTMACNIAPESAGTASGIVFFGFIIGNCISPLSIGALGDIDTLGLKFTLIAPALINVIGAVIAYRIRKFVS